MKNYELKAEWLSNFGRTENDVLTNEDGEQYIVVRSEMDDDDRESADETRVFLPSDLQF